MRKRLEEVPLRDPLQVGVVGADPGQRRQAPSGPVQVPAGPVVVGPPDERGGMLSEELHDPGAYRDLIGTDYAERPVPREVAP
jgi:hypothetical protein